MVDFCAPSPYIPSLVDDVLQDLERSAVVYGAEGSGKGTALEQMKVLCRDTVLLADWAPSLVDAKLLASPQIAVFASLRSAVTQAAIDSIREQPQVLGQLSPVTQECLRWLLELCFRPRRLQTLSGIIPDLATLLSTPYTDLYPNYDPDSIRCQLDEMILLANELGHKKIVVVLDAPSGQPSDARRLIARLLAWRDLWQQTNFLLKAAVPYDYVQEDDLVGIARGRIVFVRQTWSLEQCLSIAQAWAENVNSRAVTSLHDLADASLLDKVVTILHDIRAEHLPYDWKRIGELLAQMQIQRQRRLSWAEDGRELRRRLYHDLAPLCVEPDQKTLRRGRHRISLRYQQMRVLSVLWRIRRGETHEALMNLTGSTNNLHKQISELRKDIEPHPHVRGEWIYLRGAGDGNYFLEGIQGDAPVPVRN